MEVENSAIRARRKKVGQVGPLGTIWRMRTVARELANGYAWDFKALEVVGMAEGKDVLAHAVGMLLDGRDFTFKIKPGPHGPEFETALHDTPETLALGERQHARALEAWEWVEKIKAETTAMFESEVYKRAQTSIKAPLPYTDTGKPLLGDAVAQWSALENARLKDKQKSWSPKRRALAEFEETTGTGTPVASITGGMYGSDSLTKTRATARAVTHPSDTSTGVFHS